jgi:hypothetical protein
MNLKKWKTFVQQQVKKFNWVAKIPGLIFGAIIPSLKKGIYGLDRFTTNTTTLSLVMGHFMSSKTQNLLLVTTS